MLKEATVIREGRKYNLITDNLVLGDIVEVRFGDRIPADIRVLKSSGFKVCLSTELPPCSRVYVEVI